MKLKFRNWLESVIMEMSHNPKVITPYVQNRMRLRLEGYGRRAIHYDRLRDDYKEAIEELLKIVENEKFIAVAHRKAMRHYEIIRDRMEARSRQDDDYMREMNNTDCLGDLYSFAAALEDMSRGKIPDLESLI